MSSALDHELDEAERELDDELEAGRPAPLVNRETRRALERSTEASSWKRSNQPELHELPDSGNVALLRRPSVLEMLRKGEIPNPLLDAALQAAQGEPLSDYGEAAEFLSVMVASAFVEPRCLLDGEPGDGEIALEWLADKDRQYVLAWVQEGLAGLAPFRQDGAGARDGGDGEDVRDAAE